MNNKMYAVLMEKNIITSDFVLFQAQSIVEGEVKEIEQYDKSIKIIFYPKDSKNNYVYFTDDSIIESNEKIVAGYIISKEELMKKYSSSISKALAEYEEFIFNHLHVGGYNLNTGSLTITPINIYNYLDCINNAEINNYQTYKETKSLLSNNAVLELTLPSKKIKEDGHVFTSEMVDILLETPTISEVRKKLLSLRNLEDLDTDYEIREKRTYKEKEIEKLETEKDLLNSIKDPLIKLNGMVGLEEIKERINDYIDIALYNRFYSGFDNKQIEEELLSENINMLFIGEAGTGKSTVVSLFADILSKLGYIKNNKVKRLLPSDFIGSHVGESEEKVKEIIKENRGGIIIVDEAYQFSEGETKYSKKVIPMIMNEMEKYGNPNTSLEEKRNRVTFFFAGYSKEMQGLLELNSGLASRLFNTLEFKNYTSEQLFEIFINKIKTFNKDFILDTNVERKIIEIIEIAKENENFGNARFIDKLYSNIIKRHKRNIVRNHKPEDFIISENDISETILKELGIEKIERKKLGF